MAILVESAAMALTLFAIGVLGKYADIVKKAEKGFRFMMAGAVFFLLGSVSEFAFADLGVLSAGLISIGGLISVICSGIAFVCVLLGAVYAAQDLLK